MMDPICAHDSSDNDDASYSEEDHETDSLRQWEAEFEECTHWEDVYDAVSDNCYACLCHEWWAFFHAVAAAIEEVPVAFTGTVNTHQ